MKGLGFSNPSSVSLESKMALFDFAQLDCFWKAITVTYIVKESKSNRPVSEEEIADKALGHVCALSVVKWLNGPLRKLIQIRRDLWELS
jgi:hypothetical protein